MIIYSELTGKKYNTVEECIAAEKELKEQVEREREQRRKEREELKNEIQKTYKVLVNNWKYYIDLLERAECDVTDLEDKAILFVEIITDAERANKTDSRS